MRRVVRKALDKKVLAYLSRKQIEVDKEDEATQKWDSARQTKTMKIVLGILIQMSGNRERCMYCQDSRGTTIEHFWPKSEFPEKCFLWENMLLLCQGCQWHKGTRFDLNSDGMPLLLNPAEEDPWDSLFFESKTGMIAARYEAAIEAFSPRGAHTIDPKVLPLNIEAVTEARLRTTRNLRRAVSSLLKSFDYANPAADEEGQTNLLQAIRDNDSYGLAVWFFIRDGREESPFDDLRRNHGELWARVGELLNG